jgi:heptosyltransferase-1
MKILFIRVGRMGDMVMLLPALLEVRRQHPEACLYMVTSKDGLRLMHKLGFKEDQLFLYRPRALYRLRERFRFKRYLKKNQFDKIYCFETKPRWRAMLPGYAAIIQLQNKVEHYSSRCLQLVASSLKEIPPTPYLSVQSHQAKTLNSSLLKLGITDKTFLVGFHPTFSGYGRVGNKTERIHRLWPWQNFTSFAKMLTKFADEQDIDLKIVMDLKIEERRLGLKIQEMSQGRVLLLRDRLDFERYLCLLQRMNLLVTANTGVMHLAAALDTPMVVLFSGYDPADCGPFMSSGRYKVLRAEDTVNPMLGLQSLDVEKVFQATVGFLGQLLPQAV